MSEPCAVATAIRELIPGLLHYRVHDERIDFPSDAFAVVTSQGVVLVDPLPLEDAAMAGLGRLEAIVLSGASHQRSAWRYRRRTGVPVHAPRGAPGLEETPDATYGDGDRLPGGLRAVHAPGPAEAHYVLYLAQGPGVLLLGDLMLRRAGGAVEFLPVPHTSEPERARQSAWRLLEYRFDLLGFGHGEPLLHGGRQAFENLVRTDAGREG